MRSLASDTVTAKICVIWFTPYSHHSTSNATFQNPCKGCVLAFAVIFKRTTAAGATRLSVLLLRRLFCCDLSLSSSSRWKRPGLATGAASSCIYDTRTSILHPSRCIFLLFIGCDRRIAIRSGSRHSPGRACAGRPGRTAIAQRHRDGVAPPARQRDRR